MPFTNGQGGDPQDVDRRARRTRESLRRAMGKLLMERDLKDISVTEVAALADVNRSTFYLHYEDIDDLYRRTEDDIVRRISALIAAQPASDGVEFFTATVRSVVEYLSRNIELCAAIVHYNGAHLVRRLIEENRPRDEAGWRRLLGDGELPREYCYTFITQGCVGVILRWLENGAKESPEFIAGLSRRMVLGATGK